MGSQLAARRAARSAVVPVSVAAAERLHVLAHRAAVSGRNLDDWWDSPIETGLAAVALARHSRAYRSEAEHVLERLLRWWRDESPRRVSGDAVALALTARAAAELQRADPALTAAAVAAVADLAERDRSFVPELHLALAAWALSSLVSERDAAPWPALVARLDRPRLAGVDEPLRRFALALARHPFDANVLVQELIAEIGSAPGLSESAVLLWLISAGCEELSLHLPQDDNALQVLLRRRAEMVERLAGEIDERTFIAPDVEEVDQWRADAPAVAYLTSFEALLIDLGLASRDDVTPWLTFSEAQELFGGREAAAREELRATREGLFAWIAGLVTLIAGLAGLSLWLGLRTLGVEHSIANSGAVSLAAFVLVVAFALLARGRPHARLIESLGIFFGLLGLCAAAVAVNQTAKKPYISDITGLVVSALIAVGGVIIFFAVSWLVRERRPSV